MTQAAEDSTNLFQLAGIGVVETDMTSGRFLRVNQAFCELVGYSEAELQTMTNTDLTHPEDWERDGESFAAMKRGELTEDKAVTRVLHKDGHGVWLELNITVLGDRDALRNIAVVNDLTERKLAEQQLQESEANLRAFIAASSEAVYSINADWSEMRFLEGKRFIADTTEPSVSWLDTYIPDEDKLEVRAVIEATIREKRVFELEHRVIRADGSLGWTASRAIPLMDAQGEVSGWFGTAQDITFRKHAEAALRESEAKYRTLFNSMDEGYCVIEVIFDEHKEPVDYRFLEVNAAFERQTGLVNATGKRMLELAPEHEARWFETYGRIALTGKAERFEHRAASLGFDYDVYAFRVSESDEHKVAVLFNDVSKRKRIEVALRVSEERLRLTVESIPNYAIFTTDPDGFITSWNSGAEGVFSYSEDDIIGQDVAILFTTEDRQANIPEIELATARDTGKASDDRWHVRKDGERFYVNGTVAPLWAEGTLTGYVKIARDLTRQREAEEEREMLLEAVQDFNTALEERVKERTAELEGSNIRFSQAFALSPIPATISTLGRETFLEVNEAFLKLTGYTRDEIISKNVFELAMWSSREDQQKLEEVHAASQGFRELELHLRNKDGNVHDILLSAEIIRIDDGHGYLKMFYDISDRKRTERELAEALRQVVSDTNWFSQRVMERLGYIRAGEPNKEIVELTGREREILEHLAKGWGNKKIAKDLRLNEQTVRNYISNLYSKLDVHSRAEAIVWARERNIGS